MSDNSDPEQRQREWHEAMTKALFSVRRLDDPVIQPSLVCVASRGTERLPSLTYAQPQ
jgi:hypothetical protein